MVCGDKERGGLINFIPDVSKWGKHHQDLYVNMCVSLHVRKFGDRSCSFYLKCSYKSYILFLERTAVCSNGMNEMSIHIGIKVKAQHNKKAYQK